MSTLASQLRDFERGPRADFDLSVPLDCRVAAQMKRTPHAIALSDESESLTYEQMWGRVLSFSSELRARGVERGCVVAVCAERSVQLPIVLLAIMHAGGAYCPLDPDQPAQRLGHVVDQARPSLIVASSSFENLARAADHGLADIVVRESVGLSAGVVERPLAGPRGAFQPGERGAFHPDDAAYVMFTSGSTGRPKGVVVPHRGVLNRLLWMQDMFGLTAGDTVLQKTPYSFDVSVWELFWPLLAGARLHMAEPGGHRDPRYLGECIIAEEVTTVHFVPSMLALFLDDPLAGECSSLRRVIVSGEALPAASMSSALETLYPATLWNLYGPTEASIDVTCWRCRAQPISAPVPIGTPISNVDCFVLDERGERVALGDPGELCLGGVQLALGYIGQPELTAERFVDFAGYPGKIYRTGDIARWRTDGMLDYLGRLDRQVKLHGVRVELGEIETVMRQLPEVADAAVILRDDIGASPRLAAYVVVRVPVMSDVEIRRALTQLLPGYMLPAYLTIMARLPRTASGKLDRGALPPPALARHRRSGSI